MKEVTPKIYVACLAAYNNGKLHGKWIDATEGADHIYSNLQQMLKSSPEVNAEEWAIHDYEGFYQLSISEYCGIEEVVALAEFVSNHGNVGAMLIEHFCGDIQQASKTMLEGYFGEYEKAADFAEETVSNSIEIPKTLEYYIDWEAMARDMEINGEFFTLETGYEEIHIFVNF